MVGGQAVSTGLMGPPTLQPVKQGPHPTRGRRCRDEAQAQCWPGGHPVCAPAQSAAEHLPVQTLRGDRPPAQRAAPCVLAPPELWRHLDPLQGSGHTDGRQDTSPVAAARRGWGAGCLVLGPLQSARSVPTGRPALECSTALFQEQLGATSVPLLPGHLLAVPHRVTLSDSPGVHPPIGVGEQRARRGLGGWHSHLAGEDLVGICPHQGVQLQVPALPASSKDAEDRKEAVPRGRTGR